MKRYTLALLITSSVALAGDPDSAKSPKGSKVVEPPKPELLWNWFAGGSGGYLTDNESGYASGHVGVDLPWKLAGLDQAVFLEVGWTECDGDFDLVVQRKKDDKKKKKGHRRGRKAGGMTSTVVDVDTELQIIPVTLNYKLEYEIVSHLKLYAGAGAGIAFVDADASGYGDDDDVVFFGQVFGGLLYELTDSFELFAGVRGVYMDEPDLMIAGTDFGENVLETDLLIEGGGRLNF